MVFGTCKRGPGRIANKRYGPKKFNTTDKAPPSKRKAPEENSGQQKRGRKAVGGSTAGGEAVDGSTTAGEEGAQPKRRRGRPKVRKYFSQSGESNTNAI